MYSTHFDIYKYSFILFRKNKTKKKQQQRKKRIEKRKKGADRVIFSFVTGYDPYPPPPFPPFIYYYIYVAHLEEKEMGVI
jgi:hypothetical protein